MAVVNQDMVGATGGRRRVSVLGKPPSLTWQGLRPQQPQQGHVAWATQRSGWKGGRLMADLGAAVGPRARRGEPRIPWLAWRGQTLWRRPEEQRRVLRAAGPTTLPGGFRPGRPCPALCPSPLAEARLHGEGPAGNAIPGPKLHRASRLGFPESSLRPSFLASPLSLQPLLVAAGCQTAVVRSPWGERHFAARGAVS